MWYKAQHHSRGKRMGKESITAKSLCQREVYREKRIIWGRRLPPG